MTGKVKRIPDGYEGITPYITVNGAANRQSPYHAVR
jgi:hypothetical protein